MINDFAHTDLASLLGRAQSGDHAAVAELLARHRPYLALLARLNADRQLRPKLSDSDLVQDACLSAYRDFAKFRGASEAEFTAWLRAIMANVAMNHSRDLRRRRRDVRMERQLYNLLSQSSVALERALADPNASPAQSADRRERAVLLAAALDRLPADHRDVLILRELEGKPLTEVAEAMNRTPNAIQKLWARALVNLRRELSSSSLEDA